MHENVVVQLFIVINKFDFGQITEITIYCFSNRKTRCNKLTSV
jgi:hypothetical protein